MEGEPQQMGLFRSHFNCRVAVAESALATLECDESALFPAERAALRNAVAKRRREFVAGRVLARRAMAVLGFPQEPVLVGARRAPIWPAGLIGSISHTATGCAVALTPDRYFRSIGLDVEDTTPLEPEL